MQAIRIVCLLLIISSFVGCLKQTDKLMLPYAKDSLMCKINGELFVTSGPYVHNNVSCTNKVYISSSLVGKTVIFADKCSGNFPNIIFYINENLQKGSYVIGGQGAKNYSVVEQNLPRLTYWCIDSSATGMLIISEIDSAHLAGIFEFNAISDSKEKVEITDGKFNISF